MEEREVVSHVTQDLPTASHVVATVKPWNRHAFEARRHLLGPAWHLIDAKEALTLAKLTQIQPRYVFFPHWSWMVPPEILERFECVCFHMSAVPYGQGGSPLQNLIARGHRETLMSALRMTDVLDAGPVYLQQALSLQGRAQDIFERAADLCLTMAEIIARDQPEPVPQSGDMVIFSRRTPEMSILPSSGSLEQIYDHIRMLDAETYPRAFIEHGNLVINFDHAVMMDGSLQARATIHLRKNRA